MDKALRKVGDHIRFFMLDDDANEVERTEIVKQVDYNPYEKQYVYLTYNGNLVKESEIQ